MAMASAATGEDGVRSGRRLIAYVTTDLKTWLVTFLIFSALGMSWAAASPLFSGPDEPAHAIRAYAAAHGELTGKDPGEGIPGLVVDAPRKLVVSPACYAFQPEVAASCIQVSPDLNNVKARTAAGRHPPLYYLLVGLPTLVTVDGPLLAVIRAVSVLLSAAFIASAMVTARRQRWQRWLPIGILVACTPMVLFLTGLVNPNGLEVSAAIAAWVNGLALMLERDLSGRVLFRFVIALSALALIRQLGILWLVVLVVTLLLLATRAKLLQLLRSRSIWIGAAVVGGCALAQLAWLITVRPLDTSRAGVAPFVGSTSELLNAELVRVGAYLKQQVGVFGWLDTSAPLITYIAWTVVLGALVLVGIGVARRPELAALLGLAVAVIVLPIILELPNVRTTNFFWQGRYVLPLSVGIPLLASAFISDSRFSAQLNRRRVIVCGSVFLAIGQVAAFAQAIRRYSVGSNGPLLFWRNAIWEPPIPSLLLIAAFSLAILAWIWWCQPRESELARMPDGVEDDRSVAQVPASV